MKECENKADSLDCLKSVLEPYQKRVEIAIKSGVEALGKKTKLRDACEYALLNGGKRFRPAIVLMMAKAIGGQVDVMESALAVEYFHTASLIADDLPCMDDDDERRGKKSTHAVFGETIALLSSYALIAAGYESIAKNAEGISKGNFAFSKNAGDISLLAVQNASYNTGLHGATGGQYLDLFPENQALETLNEVIQKKTISLFEISFVFGWLFGGGDLKRLDEVKKLAAHFGMAFQIADDIDDMEQDLANHHKVNVANNFGKEKAFEMIKEEIQAFFKLLEFLSVETEEFKKIAKILVSQSQL